jgi:zinc-ribbon domain
VAFCSKCGAEIAQEAPFCSNCGSSTNPLAPRPPASTVVVGARPARRRWLRTVLVVLAALIVVCIVVFALVVKRGVEQGVREGVESRLASDAKQNEIKSMRAALKQDKDLSDAMNREIEKKQIRSGADFDAISVLINNYVVQAKQIDTGACPRDFAEAYYRHLSAWSAEADAVESHPEFLSGTEAFADGFRRSLEGDPTGGAIEMKDELNQWLRNVKARDSDVKRSWEEVVALAVRYGA